MKNVMKKTSSFFWSIAPFIIKWNLVVTCLGTSEYNNQVHKICSTVLIFLLFAHIDKLQKSIKSKNEFRNN